MSSLRRRTSNSGIQWLIIGLILGLGCASVVCVAGIVLQVITIGVPASIAALPTPTVGPTSTPLVVIVTATSAPVTPTSPITAASTISSPATAAVTSVAPTTTPFVIAAVPSSATEQVLATDSSAGATTSGLNSAGTQAGTPSGASSGTSSGTQAATQSAPFPTTGAGNGSTNFSATISASGAATAIATGAVASDLTPSELVPINGGQFTMGTTGQEASAAVQQCTVTDKGQCQLVDAEDSIPAHTVTLNAFQIERYAVSFTQYLVFLNSLPTSYKNGCDGQLCIATTLEDKNSPVKLNGVSIELSNSLYNTNPVTFVTWYGADAYCKAIGRRLPTEAEWERTARATTGGGTDPARIYPWGGNWDPNNANTDRPVSLGFTKPVDSYPTGASADGVFNLSGNAGQWVSDWYDATYYKTSDQNRFINPKGPSNGQMKVWRGGGWDEVPFFARTVQRQALEPSKTRADLGFRCAADALAGGAALPAGSGTGSGAPSGAQPSGSPAAVAVTPTGSTTTLKP